MGKFRALAVAKTLQRRQAEILDEVRHTVHVHTIVMSKYAMCAILQKANTLSLQSYVLHVVFISHLKPFFCLILQRESSRDQGDEGASSNIVSVGAVPPFQKVLMNFLDNYAPVVGTYFLKSSNDSFHYHNHHLMGCQMPQQQYLCTYNTCK